MDNNKLSERFDVIMAGLNEIEPSESFDSRFMKKLDRAIALKREETVFNKLARLSFTGIEELGLVMAQNRPIIEKGVFVFAFIAALSISIYAFQPAQPSMAGLYGNVTVKTTAGWQKADAVQVCKAGDIIRTEEGSQVDIMLTGKYTMRIKERSVITVAALTPRMMKGKASFEISEGKVLVDIEKGFKGSQFFVNTKSATLKALGTKFAVDVSNGDKAETAVSVLEGRVEVKGRHLQERIALAKDTVIVGPGQRTEVGLGHIPENPQRVIEDEWLKFEELYQLGKKSRVILLIKYTPDRVEELLKPCGLYISDEKPRQIPRLMDEAVLKINEAVKTNDKDLHLEGVRLLERVVDEYPNADYDVQLLLYIGAYYSYLGKYNEAILVFEKVLDKYQDSSLASIAQCAIGIIYDQRLRDRIKAQKAFEAVLQRYPDTLEAIWVEKSKKS